MNKTSIDSEIKVGNGKLNFRTFFINQDNNNLLNGNHRVGRQLDNNKFDIRYLIIISYIDNVLSSIKTNYSNFVIFIKIEDT